MAEIIILRTRWGAYSLTNTAIANEIGTPMKRATIEMSTVFSARPSTPKRPVPGSQAVWVKKPSTPECRNAGWASSTRKAKVASTIARLVRAAATVEQPKHPVWPARDRHRAKWLIIEGRGVGENVGHAPRVSDENEPKVTSRVSSGRTSLDQSGKLSQWSGPTNRARSRSPEHRSRLRHPPRR